MSDSGQRRGEDSARGAEGGARSDHEGTTSAHPWPSPCSFSSGESTTELMRPKLDVRVDSTTSRARDARRSAHIGGGQAPDPPRALLAWRASGARGAPPAAHRLLQGARRPGSRRARASRGAAERVGDGGRGAARPLRRMLPGGACSARLGRARPPTGGILDGK
ncbi:unnamed protein product [Prorocentrum cordatum]|uniref:Uncharacterized protein n=1 Tax=Prorocentrum cordatum TaxID=2364126 RepID=A0ABN9U041_9DINO|nr:unnamed protein product [Polarella glacialis]